jgi:EAL domain-containing protein (putative c-di-GMP-specific phosphodiesterase class I)
MAHRLDMETVAEGIETGAQAAYLSARGCTLGQGYFFSRPVAASDVPTLLEANGASRSLHPLSTD